MASPSITLVPAAEAIADPALLARWTALAQGSDNLRAFLQSPWWIRYRLTAGYDIAVMTVQTPEGETVGVSPFMFDRHNLPFQIGNRTLGSVPFNTCFIMGNQLLMPPDRGMHDQAFTFIRDSMRDRQCLFLGGVTTTSYLWEYLNTSPLIRGSWARYQPVPLTRYRRLTCPASVAEYQASFTSKERWVHKRERKNLTAHGQGVLELVRIDSPDRAEEWLNAAGPIAEQSWQKHLVGIPLQRPADRAGFLKDIAAAGLLRSYLLRCGQTVCAMMFGTQMGGVYYFHETAYLPGYARLSPGKTLLFMILHDLIEHDRPQTLYFGPGDQAYKSHLSGTYGEEWTVMLLRKNIRNRAALGAHRTFRGAVGLVKRLAGRGKIGG